MEEPSSSSEREESDSEPAVALKISKAGNEECCGKYTQQGVKDNCPKYVKDWENPDEPDKKFCVEIFRQFSNENKKRYWWMMRRTFDKKGGHRLATQLLYCVKSESPTPPTTGWKPLKHGKKPCPKVKLMKPTKDSPKYGHYHPDHGHHHHHSTRAKKEVKRERERKPSITSISSDGSEDNTQTGISHGHYQPMVRPMADMRHFPYMNNARPGEIRRFALDQLVSSAHPLNPAAAKTHRSEPVGGMERIEHNLLMEGSENLIALLGENGDHVMMILNNIRDLKARHSKSMKYLKTIKKDDTKKAFQKSMDEEKRMINALIEMNTTLSRNCAYLSQVAKALQIHLTDAGKSRTHDGTISEKGVHIGSMTAHMHSNHSHAPTLHSTTTATMTSQPQPQPQMHMAPQPQPQMQQQPQPQMMQQQPQPQQMPQMQPVQPSVTQVSHRSQPTIVSIPRPPQQQIIQAQPVQQPFQVVSQQQHLRTRTIGAAMHRPTQTMTYVQQVQPRPQMQIRSGAPDPQGRAFRNQYSVRPATITTAQHRTQQTIGVPTLIQQPMVSPGHQNFLYYSPS